MRTIQEYEKVKELANKGLNKCQISRETNLPRSTIKEWLLYGFCPKAYDEVGLKIGRYEQFNPIEHLKGDKAESYAFLLGEYLGDGYIRKLPRTYRLDIYNDKKYENLNKLIEYNFSVIFSNNKINRLHHAGCWIITIHNSHLTKFFPQHGIGEKWQRNIALENWQIDIIKQFPYQFIKGLIYSDGCTFINKINGRYIYSFSQKSTQIMNLMIWALTLVGINKGYSTNKITGQHALTLSKKDHIAMLMKEIPPKT